MLTSAFTAMLFYLRGVFGILPFVLQDCLPYGSVDFIPPWAGLRCRAFAVVHYSCMPCALHMRQTRRLQNPGIKSPFDQILASCYNYC